MREDSLVNIQPPKDKSIVDYYRNVLATDDTKRSEKKKNVGIMCLSFRDAAGAGAVHNSF